MRHRSPEGQKMMPTATTSTSISTFVLSGLNDSESCGRVYPASSQLPYNCESPMPDRSPIFTREKMLNIFALRASLVPSYPRTAPRQSALYHIKISHVPNLLPSFRRNAPAFFNMATYSSTVRSESPNSCAIALKETLGFFTISP